MKKYILFVDDESSVLNSLRRNLYKMREKWDMEFVSSGREALSALEKRPVDIVISDVMMPQMDGIELLEKVRTRYPKTVRFILSGHFNKDLIVKAAVLAHQSLMKPCDPPKVKTAISRTLALRELMNKGQLQEIVSKMNVMSTPPEHYKKLLKTLGSPQSSLSDVARIVSEDVIVTGKILQLVNSPFFGFRSRVENISHAVSCLGINLVRAIVTTEGLFHQFSTADTEKYKIEQTYRHSFRVGLFCAAIVKEMTQEWMFVDDAVTVGTLHDIGKVLMAANIPEDFEKIQKIHSEDSVPTCSAEEEILGVNHAEVGGYLLGVWGFPDDIVEAVSYHHNPSQCINETIGVLPAVHISNVLEHEQNQKVPSDSSPALDTGYLEKLGLLKRLSEWQELCSQLKEEGVDS